MAKAKKNYTPWIVLGVVAVLILMMVGTVIGSYNSLVTLDEAAEAQWANVESSYQRRFDLIPNLVATVQGAADFEQETLTEITAARSAWAGASNVDDKMAAANGLEGALGRLMVVMENYPTLTATQGFQDLQAQLEGTENRINVERSRYNEAVKAYNTKRRVFPTVMFANMFGFESKDLFESVSGAETAPSVEFNY